MAKPDEERGAIKRLMPWIWRLEAFLLVFYSMAIWGSQCLFGGTGRIPLVCILTLAFGAYFFLKGIGAFDGFRQSMRFCFSHSLTTPASLCAMPPLLAVAVANDSGIGGFVAASAMCAAAGPLALLAYGAFIANPVRLSNIYSDFIARGVGAPRKKP